MSLNVREARLAGRKVVGPGRAVLKVHVPGLGETLRGLSDGAHDVIVDVLTVVLWQRFRWEGWRPWEALPLSDVDVLEISLRREG